MLPQPRPPKNKSFFHHLFIICILFLLSARAHAQLGYVLPVDDKPGRAFQVSNDGYLVYATHAGSDLTIGKMTEETDPIWTVHLNVYGNSFYMRKLINVPGNGYYYFCDNEMVHVGEDGTVLAIDSYDFSSFGIDPLLFDDSLHFTDVTFTGTDFHLCASEKKDAAMFDDFSYLFLKIDLDGATSPGIVIPTPGKLLNEDMQIAAVGDSDYVAYDYYDEGPGEHDVHIDILNGGTGSIIDSMQLLHRYCNGVQFSNGKLFFFGDRASATGSTVISYIDKIDPVLDAMWESNISFALEGDAQYPELRKMVKLESGNFLGLIGYITTGLPVEMRYRLVLLSVNGEVLNITPVIYNTLADGYAGLINMSYLGYNQIGFSGEDPALQGIVMVTDTMGNYLQSYITGQLYDDANGNGVFDDGEITFHNEIVQTDPVTFYGVSDATGHYAIRVYYPGTYSVSAPAVDAFDIPVPAAYTGIVVDSLTNGVTYGGKDFQYDYSEPVADISVTLVQTESVVGVPTSILLTIKNSGNQYDLNGTLQSDVPHIFTFNNALPAPDDQIDTTMFWYFTDLDPGQTQTFTANYNTTTDIYWFAHHFKTTASIDCPDDTTTWNNTYSEYYMMDAAIDPNHKYVSPAGDGADGLIPVSTPYLDYTIEFQNTGTAPARDVVLHDTLSNLLDMASIDILGWSDPFQLYLTSPNILRFEFDSIMLPDSATDLAGSIGFVQFRIKIKDSAVENDTIKNTAQIIFDYNPAIITNTTVNTLKDQIPLVVKTEPLPELNIYPNPASDQVNIQLPVTISDGGSLLLKNISGSTVLEQTITPATHSISLSVKDLPAGIYTLVLLSRAGKILAEDTVIVLRH